SHFQLALILTELIAVGLFAVSRGWPAALAAAVFAFVTANGMAAGGSGGLSAYRFYYVWKERASETSALLPSKLFLNKFVPHSDNMFVWWNRNEKLHSPSGCELSEGYFGLSLASFGMQYLATPWGGMPEPEELPANSRSLLTGVSALAVPTADYGN